MNVSSYITHLAGNPRHRSLMTRILFNRMGFADQCPVDVSELQRLSGPSRAIVNGLLDFSPHHPGLINGEQALKDYQPWFEPRSPKPHTAPFQSMQQKEN